MRALVRLKTLRMLENALLFVAYGSGKFCGPLLDLKSITMRMPELQETGIADPVCPFQYYTFMIEAKEFQDGDKNCLAYTFLRSYEKQNLEF